MPDLSPPSTVIERLNHIHRAIAAAQQRSPAAAKDITLIAVSKTFTAPAILPLLQAGQKHFGENRVQEAADKWPDLKAQFPDVVLHLIGSLQTNKAKQAVALFDVIHSIDRPKLAHALAKEFAEQARPLPCYIQVNIGEEDQKGGVALDDLTALVSLCRDQLHINLVGLMCIPPADEDPSPYFALLAELARRHDLSHLSMGMSSDFEVAVELGATCVRVGSALFGQRA